MSSLIDNEKICMSWASIKNKNIRCKRNKLKSCDFCYYHKKSAVYMPQIINSNSDVAILDKTNMETLLGMYDSWAEIPDIYRIKLGNRWWDIRILVNIFSNQLCTTEMQRPKPTYLHDPFDRRNFTPNELIMFADKCKKLKLTMYIALKEFLMTNISHIYTQEYGTSFDMMNEIIKILNINLRYRILNYKNSQDSYTGCWVYKNEPLSTFEKVYKCYDDMPMQIIVYTYYDDILVDNPVKLKYKLLLDKMQEESTDIISNYTDILK